MTDCICGNPEGTHTECERCRLIARIKDLESFVLYVFDLAMQGAAILRDQALTVKAKAEQSHIVTVAGVDHPRWKVANATTLISETAGELAKETMVGCCWFEMGDGSRVYSLRTRKESNVDCSAMAKHFGGGGHPGAAGFKLAAGVPHPWNREVSPFEKPNTNARSGMGLAKR